MIFINGIFFQNLGKNKNSSLQIQIPFVMKLKQKIFLQILQVMLMQCLIRVIFQRIMPVEFKEKIKKVPGMMKDEAGGKIIEGFVGLRAKLYSYKMFEGKEEKKCKGIKKAVIKKHISFDDYVECLFSKKLQMRKMNVIRSHQHEIFSETVNKIALSADDDKRIIMDDKISTLAFGNKIMLN